MKKEITTDDLQRFETAFDSSRVNKVAMNAAAQAGVNGAARNYAVQQNNPYSFSIEVEAGKVCDQKSSGRCWMFAALNVMRLDLMDSPRTIRCSMTNWKRPTIFWKICLRRWMSRETAAW